MKSTLINNPAAYCVIMAGGIGSRFWPLSRSGNPKQFLDILGTGKTMLEETCDRFEGLIPFDHFLVMTGEQFEDRILRLVPALSPAQVLTEPERRNTAPAIAYAAYKIFAKDPDAVMVITPSDHFIGDNNAFRKTLNAAIEYAAESGDLLTIGIRPAYPATGYGYIEADPKELAENRIAHVTRFKEKPALEEARELLRAGNYLWNSGMFVWKARSIVDALETCLPEVAVHFAEIRDFDAPGANDLVAAAFLSSPSISIDYGVMEKAGNVSCVPGDFGWDDVGTWSSLRRLEERTEPKEAKCVFAEDSPDSVFRTTRPGKKIIAIGLEDYVVADTDDLLFIAPKGDEARLHEYIRRFARETDTE